MASEEFSVVLQDMDALQERIKLLQEELSAAQAERTGRSLFLLTVVTVLALPINIVKDFAAQQGLLQGVRNGEAFAVLVKREAQRWRAMAAKGIIDAQ